MYLSLHGDGTGTCSSCGCELGWRLERAGIRLTGDSPFDASVGRCILSIAGTGTKAQAWCLLIYGASSYTLPSDSLLRSSTGTLTGA